MDLHESLMHAAAARKHYSTYLQPYNGFAVVCNYQCSKIFRRIPTAPG